jgi:hypothetical protein
VSTKLASVLVTNADDLSMHLDGPRSANRPAILLSASVPYRRQATKDMTANELAELEWRNEHYTASARPLQIRSAVMELTKAALMHNAQLIFGAHPAISPMVLDAARNIGAPPDSILIFQSQFYEKQIPGSTLDLADWSAGRLFFTRRQPADREYVARNKSLTEMRSIMVSPSNLRGAVFVGGMEGVEEEAQLFKSKHGNLPRYAIASTGSAAADLFFGKSERAPGGRTQFTGRLAEPDLLESGTSYSLLAREILKDMGISRPQSR